jgi:hypothetical protein
VESAAPTPDHDSIPLSPNYDNWCAVSGYFDGDGGLDVDVRKHTLHFVLNFVDNWPPQLWQIKLFLEREGVRVGAVRRAGVGGFKVEVAAIESLMRCAEAMLETRCLFKKRGELEMMLSYFKDKVTGNQVIEFLNEEVKNRIRVGKLRLSFDVPCTYSEGLRIYKKGYKRIGPSTLQALTEKEKEEIRESYVNDGSTIYKLAPAYGVSPSTIFKTIRGLKRGSGRT